MALTITQSPGPQCGCPAHGRVRRRRGIMIWLPGRVLTEGRAAAIEASGAASQIPADCDPEVYDEGFWSRVDAWPASSAVPDPSALCRHLRCPGPVDGLARGWLWRCRGWWS